MNRLIWRATRVAATGAFALLATLTMASAQDAPPGAAPPPAEDSAAPPVSDSAAAPQASTPPASTDPSGCKGLAEKPCRKNNGCYWIIPKEADSSGKVKAPYCHKRGHTKKKATTTGAAMPQGAAQPAAPPPVQTPPPVPPPQQSPAEQTPPAAPGEAPN